MAASKLNTIIQWSGANFVDVAAGGIITSDPITLALDAYALSMTVLVDNQGTPISGDVSDFYLSFTNGDVSGDANDDYDTEQSSHLHPLRSMDTFGNSLDGSPPTNGIVQKTFNGLPIGVIGFALISDSKAASILQVRAIITQSLSGI